MVQQLKNSLTLTEAEKQFIMSHSMAKVNSWSPVCNVLAPPFAWFMAYNAGHKMNEKLNMFSKPRYARLALVGWLGAMHLLLYVMWFNLGNAEFDSGSLEQVCRTREDAEAGLSYYRKVLQRNKLLREMIGEDAHYYIQVLIKL